MVHNKDVLRSLESCSQIRASKTSQLHLVALDAPGSLKQSISRRLEGTAFNALQLRQSCADFEKSYNPLYLLVLMLVVLLLLCLILENERCDEEHKLFSSRPMPLHALAVMFCPVRLFESSRLRPPPLRWSRQLRQSIQLEAARGGCAES